MNELHRSRIRGSLLGGAVGDALGVPIAFESLEAIRARFGPRGLEEPVPAFGRMGAISGTTQLMLFTAEGLLIAARDPTLAGRSGVVRSVHRASLRWLRTQGEHSTHPTFERSFEGRLLGLAALQQRRAPDSSCLAALRTRRMGRIQQPLNTDRGCGVLMRAAPIGLARGIDDPFGVACEVGAITHGHPGAYLACGTLARLIREVFTGTPLHSACHESLEELCRHPGHQECSVALERALALAEAGGASPEAVQSLGTGQTAAQALAIGVFCSLATTDFACGLRLAVNHDGDSSSTGAVAGCLLGAARGPEAIPPGWLELLELRQEIERLAEELSRELPTAAGRARNQSSS
jgi:ADP-ribosyl-[dinitrogen reductase] hydrolase